MTADVETLVRYLIERKGFTEVGARKAVASYIETMAYVAAQRMGRVE